MENPRVLPFRADAHHMLLINDIKKHLIAKLPYLPRSVGRQKEWRPRSFHARRTAARDTTRRRQTSRRTATPRETSDKAQRCRCGQVPVVVSLAPSSDAAWVPYSLLPENKPNKKPIPQSSGSHAVLLSLSTHSHERGQEKREFLLPCRVLVALGSRQSLPGGSQSYTQTCGGGGSHELNFP